MALRADDVDFERDRTLVRRFQAGDEEAFGELYRRYHDRLERFCRKRVGDEHTAEEVAQEAFTRALTALPDLRGELRFYPWMTVIASRLCVDSHRRLSRAEPTRDLDPGVVFGGQDEIVEAVDAALVATALARLAPRHRDVLHLREVEGWSYQRIAEHYGVPVGTVETLLFRARRSLRRQFHLVDRAGLAGLPIIGRVIQVAARVRSRIPVWVPTASAPSTLAATAAATAAAVALVVIPARAPARAPVAPPAHQAVGRASAGPGSNRIASRPTTALAATSPPAGAASGSDGPSIATAAGATGLPDEELSTTTTTLATSPSGPPVLGGTATTAPSPASQPPVSLPVPIALPSVGDVTNALGPASLPTLPPLQVAPLLPGLPVLPALSGGTTDTTPGPPVTLPPVTIPNLLHSLLP